VDSRSNLGDLAMFTGKAHCGALTMVEVLKTASQLTDTELAVEFDRLHKGLDQALKDLIECGRSPGSLESLKERIFEIESELSKRLK
jgi:hypothetical protein